MLLDPNKQDNAKQNNFNILAYPRQAKQNNQQQMQLGVQEKGTSNSLLVRLQTGEAIMKVNMAKSQIAKSKSPICPSYIIS